MARLSRAELQELNRAKVLAAAKDEFADHGFRDAKIDSIAERAGLTRGGVYSNFPGKRALYFSVLADLAERATEPPNRAPSLTVREALGALARAWVAKLPLADADEPHGAARLAMDLLPEIQADQLTRRPFAQLMKLDAILLGLALERLRPPPRNHEHPADTPAGRLERLQPPAGTDWPDRGSIGGTGQQSQGGADSADAWPGGAGGRPVRGSYGDAGQLRPGSSDAGTEGLSGESGRVPGGSYGEAELLRSPENGPGISGAGIGGSEGPGGVEWRPDGVAGLPLSPGGLGAGVGGQERPGGSERRSDSGDAGWPRSPDAEPGSAGWPADARFGDGAGQSGGAGRRGGGSFGGSEERRRSGATYSAGLRSGGAAPLAAATPVDRLEQLRPPPPQPGRLVRVAETALTVLNGASQMAAAAPGFLEPFNVVRACEQLADLELNDSWVVPPFILHAQVVDEPWTPPHVVDAMRKAPARLNNDGVVAILGLHRIEAIEEAVRASPEGVTLALVTGEPDELAPLARLAVVEMCAYLRQAFPASAWPRVQVVCDETGALARAAGVPAVSDGTEVAVRIQGGRIVLRADGRGACHAAASR
jgi:AcrR family transcriptional regulator